jgi:hypothetical protein
MQDGEISYSTQQYKRMQHTVLEVSQTSFLKQTKAQAGERSSFLLQ